MVRLLLADGYFLSVREVPIINYYLLITSLVRVRCCFSEDPIWSGNINELFRAIDGWSKIKQEEYHEKIFSYRE